MSVVLNGTTYDESQFVGWGFLSKFPTPIFADMLAELSNQFASVSNLQGLAAMTAGNIAISDGANWRRSRDTATRGYLRGLDVADTLLPEADNTRSLGSAAFRWSDVRAMTATFSSVVSAQNFIATAALQANAASRTVVTHDGVSEGSIYFFGTNTTTLGHLAFRSRTSNGTEATIARMQPASGVGLNFDGSMTPISGNWVSLSETATVTAAANGDNYYGFKLANNFARNGKTGLGQFGLRLAPAASGAGTIDNVWALYIDTVNQGTNSYAIYTNGGLIRFGGAVTIASGDLTLSAGVITLSATSQIVQNLTSSSSSGSVIHLKNTATNGRDFGIGNNFNAGTGEFEIYDYTAGGTLLRISAVHDVYVGAGNLLALSDASLDIGASGANRFRDFFLSRNAVLGGNLTMATGVFSATGSTSSTVGNITATHYTITSNSAAFALGAIGTHATTPFGLGINYSVADPNGTSNEFIACYGAATLRMSVRSNGGVANFQANDVNLSDERLKMDIHTLESQWDRFKRVRVVRGKYRDQTHPDDNYMGLAQNIGTIWPELMDDANPRRLGIYETDLTWITRAVVQESQSRIENIEQRLGKLEDQLVGKQT